VTLRTTPSPASETIDPALDAAFMLAQADWRAVRTDVPPDLYVCPNVRPPPRTKNAPKTKLAAKSQPPTAAPTETSDRWLSQEFANSALDLAQALKLDARRREELRLALRASNPRTMTLPTKVRLLTNRTVANHTVGRREACPILQAYLEPLLNPHAYVRWLGEMAHGQFFFRGGESTAAVPMSVIHREEQRDSELFIRWSGNPPQVRQVAPTASALDRARAQQAHQRNLEAYERLRRRGRAMLATDPNAVPLATEPDASASEAQTLQTINRLGRQRQLPLINLGGTVAPANLYISEVAPVIGDYFVVMRAVLSAGDPSLGLSGGFAGFAYGVLALASVPIYCLYDTFHGTCTVETVAPRLLASIDSLRVASRGILRELVDERLGKTLRDADDRDAARFLDAFIKWVDTVAIAMRNALFRFLHIVADQGGGRIRTPVAFTSDGEWSFELTVQAADGTDETLSLRAREVLSYETRAWPASSRDTDAEVFWMMPALWEPVASAVALANQSGARVWINAANNRWGGHHPPHRVHRKGVSLDVDVGLVWRTDKVQNVVKRDYVGFPLSDADVSGNRKNTDCLHFMERIAGWILTQSFILVGVTQYLYGDAGLVEQATLHLKEFFDVSKPARMDGIVDSDGHNDHWHFEVLVGDRPTRVAPYVFQVTSAKVFERLHELALARDKDPVFWQKFAGLDAAPIQPEDFEKLPDAEDWQHWWALRESASGVPLLPVWAPAQAKRTFAANQCWAPKGDFPDAFTPGEVPT
jgi:hypothetical protein